MGHAPAAILAKQSLDRQASDNIPAERAHRTSPREFRVSCKISEGASSIVSPPGEAGEPLSEKQLVNLLLTHLPSDWGDFTRLLYRHASLMDKALTLEY